MSRLYSDGGSFQYDAAEGKLVSVKFGEKTGGAEFDGKPGGLNQVAEDDPAGASYIPYDYAKVAAKVTAADYSNATWEDPAKLMQARADNTLIGNMRDCGECHVGGGGMEFFPRNEKWDGTAGPAAIDECDNTTLSWTKVGYSYQLDDTAVCGEGLGDGEQDFDAYGNLVFGASPRIPYRGTDQDPTEYTSFNYFIDVFDEDGDGDKNEPLFSDFTKTGVLEMDCLMCHLEGYDWAAAKEAKRQGRFDASRAAGAGFGTPAAIGYTNNVADDGYGTTVVYNDSVSVATSWDGSTSLSVNLLGKLHAVPPADNCASCHQGKYQVDWKKRGEMSPETDVHAVLGCMGCHERTEELRGINPQTGERDTRHLKGETVGISLNIRDGKLGHDPAKGGAGQWDSLNNKNDWKEFKTCDACHSGTGLGARGKSFGAPNPAGAHANAGLTAMIVQKKGNRSGVANGSHLDIISCEACHITKSSEVPHDLDGHAQTYASGGCFVDGTGPDHEGRLATHDTYEVSRPMYTDANGSNFGYTWAKDGKMHAGNFLTSLFWRDKNDVDYDVNVDGRAHGMDAVLPTHILKNAIDNAADPAHPAAYAILADGVSDDAEITQQISDLSATLDTMTGITGKTQKIKLSWVTVPFTMSHQIEPASKAFGANGCTDCHGSDQFYAGTIDLGGYADFGFAKTQTAPMTKVQGGMETTFGHPNMKDKDAFISIPLMNNDGPATATATASIRDIDRSEGLYEVTFRTRNTAFYDTITGGNMLGTSMVPASGKGTTWKGWLLKLEVKDTVSGDVTPRSMMIGPSSGAAYANISDTPSVAELLAVMPANFKNGTFGFTVQANASNNGIEIVTDGTHQVRVSPQSNYGAFKIPSYVLQNTPIIPTCKGVDADDSISGRDEMVAYLNALGVVQPSGMTVAEECFGIGSTPAATAMSVAGATSTGGTAAIEVAQDVALALAPAGVTPTSGAVSYSYYNINDEAVTDLAGDSVTFTAPGVYRVVMTSTTVEGKVAQSYQYVVVKAPARGADAMSAINVAGTTTLTLTGSAAAPLPADAVALRIKWSADTNYQYIDKTAYAAAGGVFTSTVPVAGDVVNVIFYNAANLNIDAWSDTVQ